MKNKNNYQNTRRNSETLEAFPLKMEQKDLASNYIQNYKIVTRSPVCPLQ